MTYIEALKIAIADIRKRTKAGELPLEQRMIEIDAVTTQYAVEHAKAYDEALAAKKNPPINYKDAQLLHELADLALYEDLTWSHPDKMAIIEHPIMSDEQYERRRRGRHKSNTGGMQGELPFTFADNIGVDGRDYGLPLRRQLTINEDIARDIARAKASEAND